MSWVESLGTAFCCALRTSSLVYVRVILPPQAGSLCKGGCAPLGAVLFPQPLCPTHCLLLPRLSQTLSVRGESIPEDHFCHTLHRAVGMWPGAKLVDYICAESSLLGKHCPW